MRSEWSPGDTEPKFNPTGGSLSVLPVVSVDFRRQTGRSDSRECEVKESHALTGIVMHSANNNNGLAWRERKFERRNVSHVSHPSLRAASLGCSRDGCVLRAATVRVTELECQDSRLEWDSLYRHKTPLCPPRALIWSCIHLANIALAFIKMIRQSVHANM